MNGSTNWHSSLGRLVGFWARRNRARESDEWMRAKLAGLTAEWEAEKLRQADQTAGGNASTDAVSRPARCYTCVPHYCREYLLTLRAAQSNICVS
eukprot:COSAG01_NODE_4660_length_4842_cov_22.777567_9_plen_95_part_00